MSGATLSEEPTIGWYGKLPSAGDFVSRRLPRGLVDVLDDWLRRGVAEVRAAMPDTWREVFAAAPAWNCAIPAALTGGISFIGLIAPSRDRVAREFPICVGVSLSDFDGARDLLADAHGWLWTLGQRVVEARERQWPLEAFDAALLDIALPKPGARAGDHDGTTDIFDVINGAGTDVVTLPMPLALALPWPELPNLFDPDASTSFWWTNTGAGAPLRGFINESRLSPSLFVTLMRPLTPLGSRTS